MSGFTEKSTIIFPIQIKNYIFHSVIVLSSRTSSLTICATGFGLVVPITAGIDCGVEVSTKSACGLFEK